MSFGRIWQSSVERQKWPEGDKKGLVGMWSTPQANFANEGHGIGSVRGLWKKKHSARSTGHMLLRFGVSFASIIGPGGMLYLRVGELIPAQIICTRFSNTFDTVSQRPQPFLPTSSSTSSPPREINLHTYAPRTLDRASNEPCYWIEKYLRHSTFCAKIQFYFLYFVENPP